MKYINVFADEAAYNASAGSLEKPQLSYITDGGKVYNLSAGGGTQEGPADNEIWYTTINNQQFNIEDAITNLQNMLLQMSITSSIVNPIKSHTFTGNIGVIKYTNNVTSTGGILKDNHFDIYPFLSCTVEGMPLSVVDNIKTIILPNTIEHYIMFESLTYLNTINMPITTNTIGNLCFYNCISLTDINYAGSTIQWENLTKGIRWNGNCPDITIHCNNGTVLVPANPIES